MNIRSTLECSSFILFSFYAFLILIVLKSMFASPFFLSINNFIKWKYFSHRRNIFFFHSLIFRCYFPFSLFTLFCCSSFCSRQNFDGIFPPLSSFEKTLYHNFVCVYWRKIECRLCCFALEFQYQKWTTKFPCICSFHWQGNWRFFVTFHFRIPLASFEFMRKFQLF